MHVRVLLAGRGRGCVDRLLQNLQSMIPLKSALVAASAACQYWFESLVLLVQLPSRSGRLRLLPPLQQDQKNVAQCSRLLHCPHLIGV
jgi:hypothetical protein